MIKKCICEHKHQDQIHGKGRRVMNEIKVSRPGDPPLPAVRCTVCKKTWRM